MCKHDQERPIGVGASHIGEEINRVATTVRHKKKDRPKTRKGAVPATVTCVEDAAAGVKVVK